MNYVKQLYRKIKYKITYWLIKRKLRKNINSGKVFLVSDKHRGVGKTTMLVELAKELNLPIIVGSTRDADRINWEYAKVFSSSCSYKKIAYPCNVQSFIGSNYFRNGVLVDETISYEQIKTLWSNCFPIKTGFCYDLMFEKL